MKKNLKLSMLSLGLIGAGLLSSCSMESEPTYNNVKNNMLLRAPKMAASSNGHYWNNSTGTRGSDVNGNQWYQNWDRPSNVTEEEIQKVLEEASKVRVGAVNNIHIDWNNYWVQQVWTGEQEYVDGNGNGIGTGSSHMNHLLAYSDKKSQFSHWDSELGNVYEIVDKAEWDQKYEHINNFNSGSNNTEYTDDVTGEKYYGTTLMTDMYAEGIKDQFGYHNTTDSKDHYEYIILEIDGNYYICFDFYATHPEGQDANKNMDVERDWVFNDWIVKISPAYHVGETPEKPEPGQPGQPTQPEEGDKCDNCQHPDHEGEPCPDCHEGDACYDDTQEPEQPGNDDPTIGDIVKDAFDEVEINLALDNKEDEGILESHLSMHVRSATDVKVRIPVPAKYYCEADDMAIIVDKKDEFVHGGPYVTTFDIGGHEVTLTVEFDADGITITTDGINQEVIDYCWENYNDGVTFEVWNYFNDPETGLPLLTKEELKNYLNQATVEFLDKVPGKYINSFGTDHGKYENEDPGTHGNNDFHVSPTKQLNEFDAPTEGAHLNGSDINEIYEKKK